MLRLTTNDIRTKVLNSITTPKPEFKRPIEFSTFRYTTETPLGKNIVDNFTYDEYLKLELRFRNSKNMEVIKDTEAYEKYLKEYNKASEEYEKEYNNLVDFYEAEADYDVYKVRQIISIYGNNFSCNEDNIEALKEFEKDLIELFRKE